MEGNVKKIRTDLLDIFLHTNESGKLQSREILNEQHLIVNSSIILNGIADYGYKVNIQGFIEKDISQPLTENSFKVDYKIGKLYFHPSQEGKFINIDRYYSRGIIKISSERIYTPDGQGLPSEDTLQDYISSIKNWMVFDKEIKENERLRQEAEILRNTSEQARQILYNDMNSLKTQLNELKNSLESLESICIDAENIRNTNEINRQTNEMTRIDQYNESKVLYDKLKDITVNDLTDRVTTIENEVMSPKYTDLPITTDTVQMPNVVDGTMSWNGEIYGNTILDNPEAPTTMTSVGKPITITSEDGSYVEECHKIEVLSQSINSCSGVLKDKAITSATWGEVNIVNAQVTDCCRVGGDKTYTISGIPSYANRTVVVFYNYDKTVISGDLGTGRTFTTPKGTKYLRYYYYNGDNGAKELPDIQLEEGTIATPYTPYNSDKTEILTQHGLGKVDSAIDKIYSDGKIWRETEEYTFTGNENFSIHTAGTNEASLYFNYLNIKNATPDTFVNSNRFKSYNCYPVSNVNTGIFYYKNNVLGIRINKTEYPTVIDVNSFKSWLQSNPVKIQYQLINPNYEHILSFIKCLPNGVSDTVFEGDNVTTYTDENGVEQVTINGEFYKVNNIEEVTLDNTINWQLSWVQDGFLNAFVDIDIDCGRNEIGIYTTNVAVMAYEEFAQNKVQCIRGYNSDDKLTRRIYYTIPLKTASTIEELKQYLQTNSSVVYYKKVTPTTRLLTPTEKSEYLAKRKYLDKMLVLNGNKQELQCFEDGNFIIDGGIPTITNINLNFPVNSASQQEQLVQEIREVKEELNTLEKEYIDTTYFTTKSLQDLSSNKVDKVEGKKLSTNDLTNELKTKYDDYEDNKQNKTDDTLATTDKTVVGAINEHENKINILNEEFAHKDDVKVIVDTQIKSLGQNKDTSDCIERFEGRTLVNLYNKKILPSIGYAENGNAIAVKPNTKYTIFAKNNNDSRIHVYSGLNYQVGTLIVNGTASIVKETLTTDDSGYASIYPNQVTQETSEVMFLEGDFSNVDLPYFEGVQSVRDFEIVSIGENLFDKNDTTYGYVNDQGSITEYLGHRSSNFIKVKSNTKYDRTQPQGVAFYDSNKNFISWGADKKITTPINCEYVRITVMDEWLETYMFNEGDLKPYKPFHKSTILSDGLFPNDFNSENKELRELNGVKDEVNKTAEGFRLTSKIGKTQELFYEVDSYITATATGSKRVVFKVPNANQLITNFKNLFVNYVGRIILADEELVDKTQEETYVGELGSSNIHIWLPNKFTGWGDNYTPTAEEIKAYFLGWTMYNSIDNGLYNGTGFKYWIKIWNGVGNKATVHSLDVVLGSHTNIVPTTLNDQGFTPYQLLYEKATPEVYNLDKLPILTAFENGTVYYQGKNSDGTITASWLYPIVTLSVAQNTTGTVQSQGLAINSLEKENTNQWDAIYIITKNLQALQNNTPV